MNAEQARMVSLQAGSNHPGYRKTLDRQYAWITEAAEQGKRDTLLVSAEYDTYHEAIKNHLIQDGYKIEVKRKFMGCLQDPAEYVCW